MTEGRGITRQTVMRSAVAGIALAAAPWWRRRTVAAEPIKIGMAAGVDRSARLGWAAAETRG